MATLGVFALENVLLVGTIGNTLGHRLARAARPPGVRDAGGGTPTGWRAARARLRQRARPHRCCCASSCRPSSGTRDGRGLHDRVAGTAIVRALTRAHARGAVHTRL